MPIVESSFLIHRKISLASSDEDVQVIEALRDGAQEEMVSDEVLSTIDENIKILMRDAQKLNMKNTYCLFQIKFITEYTHVQHVIITKI
jgi:hypothetical protein